MCCGGRARVQVTASRTPPGVLGAVNATADAPVQSAAFPASRLTAQRSCVRTTGARAPKGVRRCGACAYVGWLGESCPHRGAPAHFLLDMNKCPQVATCEFLHGRPKKVKAGSSDP